jgi:hypothetical protein
MLVPMGWLASWLLFPATLAAVLGGAIVALERDTGAGLVLGIEGLEGFPQSWFRQLLEPFRTPGPAR